jgi:ribonuclease BN (tRNA processing enzyme)
MSTHFTLSNPMPSVSNTVALYTAEHVLITHSSLSHCASLLKLFQLSLLSKTRYGWPIVRPITSIRRTLNRLATEIFLGIFIDAFSGPYYTGLNDNIVDIKISWKELSWPSMRHAHNVFRESKGNSTRPQLGHTVHGLRFEPGCFRTEEEFHPNDRKKSVINLNTPTFT